ncbi:MAG: cell division protein FtsX [Hyphomonadaceae bacterium]|nr:cell division protein FtsX [Hyphomonadaceae bacterium]
MKPSLSPLLPKEDAREAALFFVVCALCFLAALSGLVARSAYSAADEWTDRVTGQITIRVRGDDAATARAVAIAKATPEITSARALERAESEELLRPWLGPTGVPADLPLPHLIAAEATRASSAAGGAGERLSSALMAAGIDATVDDHIVWSKDVKRATDSAGLVALVAVGLLGATGLAVIAFATHATLLARRDMVELLHLTGAKDTFIAGLFERRFLMLGVQAGALGALLAFGAAAFILFVVKQSDQQIWLLPQLSLSLADGLILGVSPLVAGIASMLAAKVTVMRSLSDMV